MTKESTTIKVVRMEENIKYIRKSMDHLHSKIDKQNGKIKDVEDAGEASKLKITNKISFIQGIGALAVIIIPIAVSFIFYFLTMYYSAHLLLPTEIFLTEYSPVY